MILSNSLLNATPWTYTLSLDDGPQEPIYKRPIIFYRYRVQAQRRNINLLPFCDDHNKVTLRTGLPEADWHCLGTLAFLTHGVFTHVFCLLLPGSAHDKGPQVISNLLLPYAIENLPDRINIRLWVSGVSLSPVHFQGRTARWVI